MRKQIGVVRHSHCWLTHNLILLVLLTWLYVIICRFYLLDVWLNKGIAVSTLCNVFYSIKSSCALNLLMIILFYQATSKILNAFNFVHADHGRTWKTSINSNYCITWQATIIWFIWLLKSNWLCILNPWHVRFTRTTNYHLRGGHQIEFTDVVAIFIVGQRSNWSIDHAWRVQVCQIRWIINNCTLVSFGHFRFRYTVRCRWQFSIFIIR